jgi:hypothetical protein
MIQQLHFHLEELKAGNQTRLFMAALSKIAKR